MTENQSLEDRIATRIAVQCQSASNHELDRPFATRFGALVVYGDLGGALMVRPDGSVLAAGWDDTEASVPSEGWCLIALAAAAFHFPELADLAPERPATARPCPMCGGPGCKTCYGLGWKPASLD
jgi:hypothetical protein